MTAAVTHTNHTTTNNKSGMDTSSAATANIASQDVGLLFVREYYTFLNKKPLRLHAFYNKDSYFVRGDEGETVQTYHGQEEIRQKIEELNFEDCKVLVTQVDSQVSAGNGILIQVLGEMCVMDGPSQKFSQTFFLAPQPNGYYVLNDIFRFLKDEVDIDYYTCEDDQQQQQQAASNKKDEVVATDQQQVVVEEVKKEQRQEPTPAPVKVEQQPSPPETRQQTEEVKVTVTEKPAAVEQAPATVVEPKVEEKKKHAKEETKGVNGTTETKKSDKQKQQQSNKATEKTAASPKAAPATPTAPRSWANLAANDSNKWGTQVSEAKGLVSANTAPGTTPNQPTQQQQQPTAATTASATVTPSPAKESTTAQTTGQSQTHQNNKDQPRKDEVTNIYVKNVHSGLTEDQLTEAFSKFGPINSLNIVNHKNCAFLEFQTAEACQKALAQHKVNIGTSVVLAERRRLYNNSGNMNRQQQQNGGNYERRQQYNRRGGSNNNNNNTPGGGRNVNNSGGGNKSRPAGNAQK
ncbi:hypothetical protein BC941DRAFT_429292 [Chlamydoabsidia padenii]|nr:hypothetical protein BC941DRAFT_429292 [Chlamydoabsidia padenii]